MKKRILSISFTLLMLVGCFSIQSAYAKKDGSSVGEPGSTECLAGGPGATSCTINFSVMFLGQETTTTSTVTCGDGYYACCNDTSSGNAAKCVPNP